MIWTLDSPNELTFVPVDEPAPPGETQVDDTQKTEVQLATLERNSFNFLE